MTVYFIGAGPGAPDLITLRGAKIIARCPVVLYAGSLVPAEVVARAPKNAKIIDTASMTLEDIVEEMRAAHETGQDVARVHSGDPSIYGAIHEQMEALRALGIPYEVVPGVPAFAAAAAALGTELTMPEISQTIILTRLSGKATPVPESERLEELARSRATLAIHLSVRQMREIVRICTPHYGANCPVRVVYRASWPDETIIAGTLRDIAEKVRSAKITRTALVLIGHVLAPAGEATAEGRDKAPGRRPRSGLYDPAHRHLLRPGPRRGK